MCPRREGHAQLRLVDFFVPALFIGGDGGRGPSAENLVEGRHDRRQRALVRSSRGSPRARPGNHRTHFRGALAAHSALCAAVVPAHAAGEVGAGQRTTASTS